MVLLLLACSGGEDTAADTDVADTDTDTDADTDADTDTDLPNEWGFHMRIPQQREVDCGGTPTTVLDADWLCTYDDGTTTAMTYVRGTAVSCIKTMSAVPIFDATAEIAVDGVVSSLTDVTYDWGGNHHNDFVRFTWGALDYSYYHSSFGFGWRACQEMDCLQVSNPDGSYVEDGCTCDRTLPVVCRQVLEDGTWGDFTDTFAVCNGDDCGG